MSLETELPKLSKEQRQFVERYLLEHQFKGRFKKKKAKRFEFSRSRMQDYFVCVPKEDPSKVGFEERMKQIDQLATEGHFKKARTEAEQLVFEMAPFTKNSLQRFTANWEKIQKQIAFTQKRMEEFNQWREQVFRPAILNIEAIPKKLMPRETDFSVDNPREKLAEVLKIADEKANQVYSLKAQLEQQWRNLDFESFTTAMLNLADLKVDGIRFKSKEVSKTIDEELKNGMEEIRVAVSNFKIPKVLSGNGMVWKYMTPGEYDELKMRTRAELQSIGLLEHQLKYLRDNLDWEENVPKTQLNEGLRFDQGKDRPLSYDRNQNTEPFEVRKLATYDTKPFLTEQSESKLEENAYDVGSEGFKIKMEAIKELFGKQLTESGIELESDEMFDLSLKSVEDFSREFARARGWGDPKTGKIVRDENAPEQWATAQAFGQGMHLAVQEKLGKFDQNTLRFGDKSYQNGKVIGEGGFGKIMRFEDKDNPENTIVVKMMLPKEGAERKLLLKEMKAHRRLMKGDETQPGRKNIVGFKGALQSEDGGFVMVMDEAKGGDLETNRFALSVASKNGVLSEQARTLLTQHRFKQAVQGMQHVRDNNMVHFDIKAVNILLDEDGTVKIADFGSSLVSDKPEGGVTVDKTVGVTEGYAPENMNKPGTETDHTFDVYSLGKLAEVMQKELGTVLSSPKGDGDGQRGSFDRLIESMTAKLDTDRVSLEGVLDSSYLTDLSNYDEKDIEDLSRATIEYGKALKKETAGILADHFTEKEIQLMESVSGSRDKLDFTDIQIKASRVEKRIPELQEQLDTASERLKRAQESAKEPNLTEEQKKDRNRDVLYWQDLVDRHQRNLDVQPLWARFAEKLGQSPETIELGEKVKEISFRVTHSGLRPDDVDNLKRFIGTLQSTVNEPAQFVRFISLPSSRECLRMAEVDPIALNQAASFYYMKTSEGEKQKEEREEKGLVWEPRQELETAKEEIEHFLSGVSDLEMRKLLSDGLFAAHQQIASQLENFGN